MRTVKPKRARRPFPELDRVNDPRGGAVVWALLVVAVAIAMAVVVSILLSAIGP